MARGLAAPTRSGRHWIWAGIMRDLAERLDRLRARIAEVQADEPAREAATWLNRARADAVQGLSRTRAIREALARAGAFEHLADQLAELRTLIAESQAAAVKNAAPQPGADGAAGAGRAGAVQRGSGGVHAGCAPTPDHRGLPVDVRGASAGIRGRPEGLGSSIARRARTRRPHGKPRRPPRRHARMKRVSGGVRWARSPP